MSDIWSRTLYCIEQSLAAISEQTSKDNLKRLKELANEQRVTKDKSKCCCFMPLYRQNFICPNCGCYYLWETSLGKEYLNRVNTLCEIHNKEGVASE